MRNVFIIGSKGIPAAYGGFETFVDKLTQEHKDCQDIKYHVACMSNNNNESEYNNAHCFNIKVPEIGAAKAVYYDLRALKYCYNYIKNNNINNAIIYILACRIGPFIGYYKRILNKLNCKLYVNPDGHEWKRQKWNFLIRNYWKISERLMVKNSDLLICDSRAIENYIKEDYKKYNPKTIFIAYGADTKKSECKDETISKWFLKFDIAKKNYYLVVGRFVPENNYEVIISEFMKSKTKRDLVIVTNVEKNKFYYELLNKTNFNTDERIKFVGTLYDQELLKKVREEAFAYFHGHEVGGTNPSLLEAMGCGNLVVAVDVNFSREVLSDGGIFFKKNEGDLCNVLENIECLSLNEIEMKQNMNINRITNLYSWSYIANSYFKLFI